MRIPGIWSFVLLTALCAGPALADDAPWSDAYSQWKAAVDAAQQRADAAHFRNGSYLQQAMQEALNQALNSRYRIEHLASSLNDRASDIDTAKFHAKIAKDDFDTAKDHADQLSAALDAKTQSYNDDCDRLKAENQRLDGVSADLKRKDDDLSARIDAHNNAPHTFTPDESAAAAAYEAERAGLEAEKSQLAAQYADVNDQYDKRDTWYKQLKQIEDLLTTDGKAVLEVRQAEGDKERDYADAQAKVDKLQAQQDQEADQLQGLLSQAMADLHSLSSTVFDGGKPQSFDLSSGSYVPRNTDDQATAVSLAPADDQSDDGWLANRVFVMPPAQPTDGVNPQTDLLQRRLAAEMAVGNMAAQYKSSPAPPAVPPPAPVDSTSLVRAPEGFVGPADDGGEAVVTLDDKQLNTPFDPGSMITRDEYESALRQKDRLDKLLPKLQKELMKILAEHGKLEGYDAEFEAIRADSVRGAIRDALSVMPVSDILNRLSADPRLAKALTPENIRSIELAVATAKMEAGRELAEGIHDPAAKRGQQTAVIAAGADTILNICTHELPEDGSSRLMLEQMGKMLKVYAKFDKYLQDPNAGAGDFKEQAGELTKLGIGVTGVYYAPVALGAGIESLGENGAKWYIAKKAMENFSASLASTQDAAMFLTNKIQETQRNLVEINRTVSLGAPHFQSSSIRAQTP